MAGNTRFFIEFLMVDVAAVMWGGWELYSLRRDRRAPSNTAPPAPEPARAPEPAPDAAGAGVHIGVPPGA